MLRLPGGSFRFSWPADRQAVHGRFGASRTYDLNGRYLTLTHPLDGGVQQYHYDPQTGLLDWTKDIRNNYVSFSYDDALRLTTTTYPGGAAAITTYDADGRLLSMSAPNIGATLQRDARGRVTGGMVNGTSPLSLW